MVAGSLEEKKLEEKEILCKVINKAKAGGFKFRNLIDNYDYFTITTFNPDTGRLVIVLRNDSRHQIIYDSIYQLFFDLTFAKALFGETWEEHLLSLSQSSNKLLYISTYLDL